MKKVNYKKRDTDDPFGIEKDDDIQRSHFSYLPPQIFLKKEEKNRK